MEIKKEWLEYAKVNEEKYSSMYDHSLQNNDEFWAEQAQRVKEFDRHAPRKYELARTLAPCAGCITLAATCGCWPRAFESRRSSAYSKTCW